MLSIEALKRATTTIQDLSNRAGKLSARTAEKIAAIENDGSRSPAWKQEQIAGIRQAGIDDMATLWTELRARYDELTQERVFWESPMFALSQYGLQGFTKGTPEEMTVRGQVLAELRMLGEGMLRLEAQGAASNRDWARLYLCLLCFEEKGLRAPSNLAALPIGNLADAEEIFFQAERAYRQAGLDLAAVQGRRGSAGAIALGLLDQAHEAKVRARAAGLQLTWDERQAQGEEEEPDPNPVLASLGRRG